MHIGYLTLAVRDVLRNALSPENYQDVGFENCEIEVMPDGKPPPFVGDKFISVYGSDWSPAIEDNNVALDAYLGVTCQLTYRTAYVPPDAVGTHSYANVQLGMTEVCWRIMKALSMQSGSETDVPLYTALTKITGYAPNSFVEYLRWAGTDAAPIPVYGDWFSGVNEHLNDENGLSMVGYTMSVRFSKARSVYAFI